MASTWSKIQSSRAPRSRIQVWIIQLATKASIQTKVRMSISLDRPDFNNGIVNVVKANSSQILTLADSTLWTVSPLSSKNWENRLWKSKTVQEALPGYSSSMKDLRRGRIWDRLEGRLRTYERTLAWECHERIAETAITTPRKFSLRRLRGQRRQNYLTSTKSTLTQARKRFFAGTARRAHSSMIVREIACLITKWHLNKSHPPLELVQLNLARSTPF